MPTWNTSNPANGTLLLKILCQVAVCCLILDRTIGFNHRDMKPDNILIQTTQTKSLSVTMQGSSIKIAESPTASMVDFGFACLGPGKTPWIQSGDDVLSPFDACPRIGRDLFMLLVFLVWMPDVQKSLSLVHMEFLKKSIHVTTERLALQKPSTWIYSLVTERRFQCLDLDPLVWLHACATTFPEIVSILDQPGS
jgi:serine/threonine protein kinase